MARWAVAGYDNFGVEVDQQMGKFSAAAVEQFRNWCRPKRQAFSWFSPKENHTSRSLSGHRNCKTLLALGFGLFTSSFLAYGAASAPPEQQDWPAYGGQDGTHYSDLSQINRDNVKKLAVAWKYDTGEKGGIEASPIIVGKVLYATTPRRSVIALDAASGKVIWRFEFDLPGQVLSRGVSYWSDGHQSRIFAGARNYLYALDAATGKVIPSFGENGRIDLRKGLREPYQQQSVELTTPGSIYKDLIIVGGANPETHPAPPGDIRAYDVRTGKLRWSFHTIPHPGEVAFQHRGLPARGPHEGAANN